MSNYTLTALCMALLLLTSSPALSAKPKVLVINSYHAESPWVQSHNRALRKGLGPNVDVSFFYMDTKRLPISQIPVQANKAMQAYRDIRPDVVVLTDDNALSELGSPITMNNTPVVYLGINANPRNYFSGSVVATGVLERPLLKRSVVFIKEVLRGKLDKCLILFDGGETAHVLIDKVFCEKSSLNFAHTTVNIESIFTFPKWKAHVLMSKEQGYNAIILGLYHTVVDDKGNHVSDDVIARWTSKHSPVPVFGFWDFAIGKGKAIGGLVLAGEPQGKEAAKIVKRILAGASPMTIPPVTAEHGRFVFSKSEMKRWGIQLPAEFTQPGEELIFVE